MHTHYDQTRLLLKAYLRLRHMRRHPMHDDAEWSSAVVSASQSIVDMLDDSARRELNLILLLEHQDHKQRKRADTAIAKDICSICLECHTHKLTVVTCCGHCFGKNCLHTVVKMARKQRKVFHCPICRKPQPIMSSYRASPSHAVAHKQVSSP